MAEFTGERLIPGEVDADLLNEHLARYAFAARLSRGKRVLDAGCGAGYGAAELAKTALEVTGVDASGEAVAYAREHYRLPNLRFDQGSVTALPYADASFDLVVAFEVIEHLDDWRSFLAEVRRVLVPSGQFIVSTPNRLYYAESRRKAGPNPFHVHEFDYVEFRAELAAVFPNLSMFLENHSEGVVFQPVEPGETAEVRVDSAEGSPEDSHFFVAVCAHRPQLGNPTFVYVPSSGNVLRERERHIALLESELETKNAWLEKAKAELAELNADHQKLLAMFREQKEEMERRNRWAEQLSGELEAAGERIVELQEEVAREQAAARQMASGYESKIAELERENQAKTEWALETERRLGGELEEKARELARCVELLEASERQVEERTAWARRLEAEAAGLQGRLAMFQASRWVKLGRRFGLGPAPPGGS
ncbi:MAG: methyltransferase domain-containing protein [Bryobacteraceae bacterium]